MNSGFLHKHLQLTPPAVHCIGVGGIGVSAIAEYLLAAGFQISGSDASYNSECQHLSELGADIAPAGHREANLPETCSACVYTAAVEGRNCELTALLRKGVMCWRRSEFVGEIALAYKRPVMVAGTHGKSSTTAMLGWILNQCGKAPGLLIGAKYSDQSPRSCVGSGDIFAAEADESDGALSVLRGELAIVTNVDGDHAWDSAAAAAQEMDFRRFAAGFRKVLYTDSEKCRELFGDLPAAQAINDSDLKKLDSYIPAFMLGHERSNAVLALTAAEYLGVELRQASDALKKYPGIDRRLQELYRSGDGRITVVNDYAHHPTELASSLKVIKERYGKSEILLLFQPHRYQRLNHYWKEFVALLSQADLKVLVMPVYSAGGVPQIDAMDSCDLVREVNRAGGRAEMFNNDNLYNLRVLAEELRQYTRPVTLLMAGAGDIEDLIPELLSLLKSDQTGA